MTKKGIEIGMKQIRMRMRVRILHSTSMGYLYNHRVLIYSNKPHPISRMLKLHWSSSASVVSYRCRNESCFEIGDIPFVTCLYPAYYLPIHSVSVKSELCKVMSVADESTRCQGCYRGTSYLRLTRQLQTKNSSSIGQGTT